ncbi:MAG: hypothetical protein OEZ39_05705 [Gammaproteobacteria bacterium]|nr:hypothetical protein [Gammaproteobacteria bacterium]MDH5651350.1 hypothetical protein [Gammaproteobacteria bacterium]
MFDPTSRYYSLETATHVANDGTQVSYKKRRFLPKGQTMPTLVEIRVKDSDRLDMITARILGNPEQYWRICDANNTNNPKELTEKTGQSIRIPIPQA